MVMLRSGTDTKPTPVTPSIHKKIPKKPLTVTKKNPKKPTAPKKGKC